MAEGHIKTVMVNGFTLNLYYDMYPENPRTFFENMGTMVINPYGRTEHLAYELDHKTRYMSESLMYLLWGEDYEVKAEKCKWPYGEDEDGQWKYLLERLKKSYLLIPLSVYEHGGIAVRVAPISGRSGFIYMSKDKARTEYKGNPKKAYAAALTYLENEVSEYNAYLNGEVYRVQVFSPEGNLETDSGLYFYESPEAFEAAMIAEYSTCEPRPITL